VVVFVSFFSFACCAGARFCERRESRNLSEAKSIVRLPELPIFTFYTYYEAFQQFLLKVVSVQPQILLKPATQLFNALM
jgi:hypothetical protein